MGLPQSKKFMQQLPKEYISQKFHTFVITFATSFNAIRLYAKPQLKLQDY